MTLNTAPEQTANAILRLPSVDSATPLTSATRPSQPLFLATPPPPCMTSMHALPRPPGAAPHYCVLPTHLAPASPPCMPSPPLAAQRRTTGSHTPPASQSTHDKQNTTNACQLLQVRWVVRDCVCGQWDRLCVGGGSCCKLESIKEWTVVPFSSMTELARLPTFRSYALQLAAFKLHPLFPPCSWPRSSCNPWWTPSRTQSWSS